MDGALRRDAIVSEATLGTTPSNPAFKILPTISVDGDPERPASRSPARVWHGQAANMFDGNQRFRATFRFPFCRDAGIDLMWESLLFSAFNTDVMKNAFTAKGFTYERKHEGGATDPYRRYPGMQCDSCTITFANDGQPGSLVFNASARDETTATAAISGATYADPSPGYDPVTAAEITASSLFGLSSPTITNFSMEITNQLRERYGFGSPKPGSHGRGPFNVRGTVGFYFSAAADYSAFVPRATGLAASFLIGSVTAYKDQLDILAADVYEPKIPDNPTGDDIVMLEFLAKYSASDAASIQLTRNVA
jgi:hypothetical protein